VGVGSERLQDAVPVLSSNTSASILEVSEDNFLEWLVSCIDPFILNNENVTRMAKKT
jgi:hypothetical protein